MPLARREIFSQDDSANEGGSMFSVGNVTDAEEKDLRIGIAFEWLNSTPTQRQYSSSDDATWRAFLYCHIDKDDLSWGDEEVNGSWRGSETTVTFNQIDRASGWMRGTLS